MSTGVAVFEFLRSLLSSEGFAPRGHSYLWNPRLVALHTISDGLTALAYTSIPFTLLYLLRKRRDIPFHWMFLWFGTFMIACGATHVVEVWTLWTPVYCLSGVVKAVTAVASVSTSALLVTLVPKALAIPTEAALARARDELQRANDALESRVLERTAELTRMNEELAREVEERRRSARLDDSGRDRAAIVVDLTEQKRADAAVVRLREEHDDLSRFRALLDAAPDAMVVVDEHGRIILVNVRCEHLFGYARSELMGQSIDLLIPPGSRRSHAGHVADFVAHPVGRLMGSSLELLGLRKDGTELPIEVSLGHLRTESGITVSAAIRDVTARKQTEAAAKVLGERLASAVESIQDAFALFDRDDRLVSCNSVYRRLIGEGHGGAIVGESYEHLLDAWIGDIAFSDEAARAGFRAERLARRSRDQTATFDMRMRDGRSLRVIDRRTADGGTVKTIWDLTDDVRLAEELRVAREAADAASRAKSEFLSSMSHELRTPLNAILGFAQLMGRDQKEPLSDRHKERVGHILKGGEHLLRLIDDILDLARIEAGGVSISVEPVGVLDLLHEVSATLGPMAAEQGIRVQVEGASPEWPAVAADRIRLAQILMNFGSNAIKYNRPSGVVTFAVSAPRPGVLRMTIRDTGMGIPLEKQDKLFQPFQRAGQEAGPIEGTGIGLVVSKRLAEMMGSDVGFQSIPEHGSEFWIDVPVHKSGVRATPPKGSRDAGAVRVAGPTRRLVLYVEDNPANVAFMKDLVGNIADVEMLMAPSAELGVEIARARRPEVVIMDINLPGMSGLDALRALRVAPETKGIPVIALTAAASEHDVRRGKEAGFYRYMTKPVNVDEFASTLEGLLDREASW